MDRLPTITKQLQVNGASMRPRVCLRKLCHGLWRRVRAPHAGSGVGLWLARRINRGVF
ncbi:MAG: hypothetical protein Ta2A_25690 [Treponemataceae bacterium]|nr:MAG: hypothetical protein Ta2A_25690 [Treponemataceae bacterium]